LWPSLVADEASRLLRSAEEGARVLGLVNHLFDKVRQAYGRALSSTLRARPVIYGAWSRSAC